MTPGKTGLHRKSRSEVMRTRLNDTCELKTWDERPGQARTADWHRFEPSATTVEMRKATPLPDVNSVGRALTELAQPTAKRKLRSR